VAVYHIDFYRIGSGAEFYLTGLEEFFSDDAVTIIEWADKYSDIIPRSALWIELEHVDETSRKLSLYFRREDYEKYSGILK
jgi:tRNA threonylcarbamoyladenosine biosynthesis protein TsaE